MDSQATIIPVAAGKGGVGKSFLAANLSIALAWAGKRVVAIDLDLGASNLHSYLGVPNRYAGIGDFLKAKTTDFSNLPVSTHAEGLTLIPGDGTSPFMANIPYAQKVKLLNNIKAIDTDFVVLDLGPGTSFNVLDFYELSDFGILVTSPEFPSVMNMQSFLKNYVLRRIGKVIGQNTRIKEMLQETFKNPIHQKMPTIAELCDKIGQMDPALGRQTKKVFEQLRPRIVINRARHPDEMSFAPKVENALSKIVGVSIDFFGFVFEDPNVRDCVQKKIPYLLYGDRDAPAAREIRKLVDRILKFWTKPVDDSANRLYQSVLADWKEPPAR